MRGTATARGGQTGQVMPLLLVGMLVVLLGFAAFAVDVGSAYFAKRQLQASSDAAALAGAQRLPDLAAATATATEFGATGKNPPRGVTGVVTDLSTKCLESTPRCSTANAVVVQQTGQVTTRFARLFGIDSFEVHAKATACSPCGEKPLDVMLVLDRTGSMCTDSDGAPDPGCTDLNNARDGIKTFLGLMDPSLDHVGLAVLPPATSVSARCNKPPSSSYDSRGSAYVVVPLADDYLVGGRLNPASDLVSTIDCIQANGSTAYADAIDAAGGELAAHGRPGVQKVVVFLSDGAANTGPLFYPADSPYLTQPCHQGVSSAQAVAGGGVEIFSIGYDLGHDVCTSRDRQPERPAITPAQALQGIASEPGNFYEKPDPGQLNTIFTSIAADILHGTSKLVDDNA